MHSNPGPGQTRIAYIALGSNLPSRRGTPLDTVAAAIEDLKQLGRLVAKSSMYETDPVGYQDQAAFVNAVVALATTLEPEELLRQMLLLERQFGRDRSIGVPKGPRPLDLDLLLIGELKLASDTLTVPHPALASRRFVLAPLAEIAPGLRPPGFDQTIAELLARLPDAGENRIASVRRLR
jgi:2-amino-4-hydroxy-6-hydroxymethyldihydropteridine diphosphokinase